MSVPQQAVRMKFDEMTEEQQAIYSKQQWKSLLLFCMFYLFYYTGRQNMGVILPVLREDLGFTHAQVGLISSTLFWTYALGQVIHGRICDSVGGKRMSVLGGLLSWFFNLMVSFQSTLLGIQLWWGANGFVQAMGWPGGMQVVAQWWPKKRRGVATGWCTFAAGLSSLVVWITAGLVGGKDWRLAFRIPTLLMLAATIIYAIFQKGSPSEVGLPEYIEEDELTAAEEQKDEEAYKGLRPYFEMLKSGKFILACQLLGLANLVRYALLTWVPTYYYEVGGYELESVAGYSLFMPLGMAVGTLLAGYISDYIFKSKRTPVMIFYLAGAGLTAIITGRLPIHNITLGVIVLFFAGFFCYGTHGPIWGLILDMGGRKFGGTATGVVNMFSYIYAAIQGTVIGFILTATNQNWPLVWLIVGLCAWVCAVIAAIINR